MAFELDPGLFDGDQGKDVSIKIVGVGGCGGNAVNNMIDRKISGVEYIVFNTDRQALLNSRAPLRVQIGKKATGGLGAGAEPSTGRQAAEDDRETIAAQLTGADLVFITAGMGKGTGTGAAPVIAEIARNMGILTIGVVTRPFLYEGKVKSSIADAGIAELRKYIDTLIIVENEKILSLVDEQESATQAFNMANEVLFRAAKGIVDIIMHHGYVNVDFADVKSIMAGAGDAVMGSAAEAGDRRALRAAAEALNSPLLEGISIAGAKGVLVNITGDVSMRDMSDALNYIEEQVGSDAKIINGYVEEPQVSGEVRVTVIVTGFSLASPSDKNPRKKQPELQSAQPVTRDSRFIDQNVVKLYPEPQEVDLRIPAYLRRNVSLEPPRETGFRRNAGGYAAGNDPIYRRSDQDDGFNKGSFSMPANLRRRNSGM